MTEEHPVRADVEAAEVEPDGTAAPPDGGVAGEPDEAPEAEALEAETAATGPLAAAELKVAELTADLKRLQAEYVNYKRRVDRDRELIRENATYAVLAPIIEVLDTIDRAREHGEVEGGFKATADQLERIVTNLGLTKFGAPGEVFDPTVHEALSHMGTDPEVKETTVKLLAKSGYRIGDRVVRAAQVLVVDPE